MAKKVSNDEGGQDKALSNLIHEINKKFGEDKIFSADEEYETLVGVVPTGILSIDNALVVSSFPENGFPLGRIVEIFGPEASGKTLLALNAISEAQKRGLNCAFLDLEQTFDKEWFRKIGVETEKLLISQPETAEEAFNICELMVESGQISLVVLDSLASLSTETEMKGELGSSNVGVMARLNSQFMRRIVSKLSKNNVCLILLSQLRDNIGVMYGDPSVSVGGRAIKFYATMRVQTVKGSQIKDGEDVIGFRSKLKVIKNKVGPAFKTAEYDVLMSEGISKLADLIDMAVEYKIIEKSGSWYSYKNERLGQGRDSVKKHFQDNPDTMSEVYEKTKVAMSTA